MDNPGKSSRKFINRNIVYPLNPDSEDVLEAIKSIINKSKINLKSIKIVDAEVDKKYNITGLVLPTSNYNEIGSMLGEAYKTIKFAKNFRALKRVFLIGFRSFSAKPGITLSSYDRWETLFENRMVFNVDTQIYSLMRKNSELSKIINNFPIYNKNEIFENNSIPMFEIEEGLEEKDFSFDLHLLYLTALFEEEAGIKIVPIWVNNLTAEYIYSLGEFLSKYNGEENLFITTTNFSYFGKQYNYLQLPQQITESNNFNKKEFLKNKNNEDIIKKFLRENDLTNVDDIRDFCVDQLKNSYISGKNAIQVFLSSINKKKEQITTDLLKYRSSAIESPDDEEYEIKIVTYAIIIFMEMLK